MANSMARLDTVGEAIAAVTFSPTLPTQLATKALNWGESFKALARHMNRAITAFEFATPCP